LFPYPQELCPLILHPCSGSLSINSVPRFRITLLILYIGSGSLSINSAPRLRIFVYCSCTLFQDLHLFFLYSGSLPNTASFGSFSLTLFSNVSQVITPSPNLKGLPHSFSALSSCSTGDSNSCLTNQELGALTKQQSSRLRLSESWNASLMDEGTLETPIPKCRLYWSFLFGVV
jgi:hypothetical protein